MTIDDTIQKLARIHQSVEQGIPKTATRPDALVNHLNDLYGESTDGLGSQELFTYDDVGSPSLTLTVPQEEADEIGRTGVIWSCGRYDFAHDDDLGQLRISHGYSHRRRDTQSVLSIIIKMIDHAKCYLEAVKQSTQEGTGTPQTD
jgi:hypothetical protein